MGDFHLYVRRSVRIEGRRERARRVFYIQFTPEELTPFLQTIPGIGRATAEKIVNAIIEKGE